MLPHLNPEPARCFARLREALQREKVRMRRNQCRLNGITEMGQTGKGTEYSLFKCTFQVPLRAFPVQKPFKACATFGLLYLAEALASFGAFCRNGGAYPQR